jgi:hypothetical protein
MEQSEIDLENWLAQSRSLNPHCGCEQRGSQWFYCPYHEGATDAWQDAWDAGYIQGAKDHY